MPAKVGYLVVDAADPESLARFWWNLLAVSLDMTIGDGDSWCCHRRRTG